ncbi:MAG: threonine/serine exporter family protein, partial [Emcibacteraceae bacterium]|nr:threonine/serine exporter family protein [Emcibacteraceae bacterium]
MSGNIADILISGILALLVYVNVYIAHNHGGRWLELLPFSSAYVIGILVAIIKIFMPEINVSVIVLSAIISIIPGFTVSAGIVEMVSNHVVSGSANLIAGVIYLLKQFFGAWFGLATIGLLWPVNA